MLSLLLQRQSDFPINILCLGAHCDDIEIGCGGTLLTLLERYQKATVHWVVFTSDEHRAEEARTSANMFLDGAASKNIVINKFKNSFLPYIGADIKAYFEQLKKDVSPDLILTHWGRDFHQDHRLISELTWNSFRNHFILEYEIPKYDGDLGAPNAFVHLGASTARKKVSFILKSFPSQKDKHWFDEETFLSVLRIRGMESLACEKYAEGFYCRKVVVT